jgi:hypothetical protein
MKYTYHINMYVLCIYIYIYIKFMYVCMCVCVDNKVIYNAIDSKMRQKMPNILKK